MPTPFTGQLSANEIFASQYNLIISIMAFANNIEDSYNSLVDRARVDGGLYGDTKLYVDTDVLKSYAWTGDNEAANLLAINRPADPKTQAIKLDIFRQIPLTVDYYLSKRFWKGEESFSQFASVLLGWLGDTKRVYDETTYNAFIGTHSTAIGSQAQTVDVSGVTAAASTSDEEAYNRIVAESIARKIANILVDMRKPSRAYNDNEFMKSFSPKSLMVVWNAKFVNFIMKYATPTIFHKDGLLEGVFNEENVLPEDYFGNVNAAATAGDGSLVRSLIEQDIGTNHYFAGELIKVGDTAPAGTSYSNVQAVGSDSFIDDEIICKIIHRDSVPYMSAFQVGTSFFNARSLTENHYTTWGHNTLEALAARPFVTVRIDV